MLVQHLRALIKRGSVTAFCVAPIGNVPPDFDEIKFVRIQRPSWFEVVSNALGGSLSLQEAAYTSRRARAELRRIDRIEKFDIVYVDMVRMAPLISAFDRSSKRPIRILDFDDRLSSRYRDLSRLGKVNVLGSRSIDFPRWVSTTVNVFGLYILRLEGWLISRSERKWRDVFDRFLFSSKIEADSYGSEFPGTAVFAMPLAVVETPLVRQYGNEMIRMVFLGNLRTDQNISSLQEILDVYRQHKLKGKRLPTLHVFGERGDFILNSDLDEQVVFHGFVDSLSEIAAQRSILIAPIWMGSGIKTKVFDCMAVGIPAVTSERGAEGLSIIPGTHFLCGTSSEQIVELAVELCNDVTRYDQLRKNALEYICAAHSKDVIDSNYDKLLGFESVA